MFVISFGSLPLSVIIFLIIEALVSFNDVKDSIIAIIVSNLFFDELFKKVTLSSSIFTFAKSN